MGVELLTRWYEAEADPERQARMDGWLADFSTAHGRDHTKRCQDRTHYSVAIVPGTGWAVEVLINDGDRQVELKGFLAL